MNRIIWADFLRIGRLCFLTWKDRDCDFYLKSKGLVKLFWRFYWYKADLSFNLIEALKMTKNLVTVKISNPNLKIYTSEEETNSLMYIDRAYNLVYLLYTDSVKLEMEQELNKSYYKLLKDFNQLKVFSIFFVPTHLIFLTDLIISKDKIYKNRYGKSEVLDDFIGAKVETSLTEDFHQYNLKELFNKKS